MKGRLFQTLLMCLVCLTSSGYRNTSLKQKVNKERQFNNELEDVLNSTESEMVVEETTNIVYAALAHDLQVTSKVYNASKRLLDLIITWTPPTSGRQPESYNLHVLPLNESHPFCMTDPYYAYIDDPRAVSWKVPPDVIPGALHEGIQINTQCSYKVSLESNPHNGKSLVSTVYTVPECVEELCSCFHANLLPRPDVSASMITKDTLNVTWIIRPTKYTFNVTRFVIGFGKVILRSSSHRHVYNMSWVAEARFISNQYFYSQLYILPSPGDYMVGVYSVDKRGCSGPVGNSTLTVTEPQDTTVGTFSKTEMFWMVMLPSASFLLAMCVAICILGQRLISWMKKRNIHNDIGMTAIHHNHFKGTYKPISITSNRTSKSSFPSHQERNLLYVEKEIEDARAKGEADSYEIGYSRLTFGKEIGKGAFGRVFLAEAEAIAGVPGVMSVAVKKLKNRVAADELEEFQAEIAMMKRVGRHANIVTMLGCCTLKQPFCMIMEYVPCGDLLQYLRRLRVEYSVRRRSRRDSEGTGTDTSYITPDTPRTMSMSLSSGRPSLSSNGWPSNKHTSVFSNFVPQLEYVLDPRELQSFATQIARGMAYLEGKDITHRDLAARNILIDEKKTLKISDFGLSRSGIYVNTRKKKVPLRWLSVEAMRDSLYSSKSDVWAFGIVLWEIGTLGGFPYPTVADFDLLNFLLQGRRLEQPENFSPEIEIMNTLRALQASGESRVVWTFRSTIDWRPAAARDHVESIPPTPCQEDGDQLPTLEELLDMDPGDLVQIPEEELIAIERMLE